MNPNARPPAPPSEASPSEAPTPEAPTPEAPARPAPLGEATEPVVAQGDSQRVAAPLTGPGSQRHNPLHGVTLEAMVNALVEHFGWEELGDRIPIRCFCLDPSVKSSLKFLRKTPWAREKVEGLYLFMLRDIKREAAWRAGSA